ncbi:hypothetical protein BD770DRAFT_472428 [Pilaira anomala]|nr:hypothetical protein BD770DRAFT_472428 [Pilaira anomala]
MIPAKVIKLLGNHLFTYDSRQNYISWWTLPEFDVLGNPTVPIQFPDPNIVSLKSLVQALSLSGMPVLSFPPKKIPKNFRQNYYQVNYTLPSSCSTERRLSVPHGSIPNRAFLFRIFPEKFTSPSCTICGLEIETTKHMLFDCPPKSFVWKNIIFEFLWPTVTIPDIITALSYMNFQDIRYVQKSGSTAQMIVYITLANIWKGHFRSSFDSTPFLGPTIFLQTKKDIASRLEEGLIHSKL